MSFKTKLDNAVKAFRDAFCTMSMSLETADGKTLELEKESGEPVVGDVVLSEDGEYLMPDGKTIVVEDGVITEIRSAEVVVEETEAERGEETEQPDTNEIESEKDAEIDRLKAEIAEKDAEIDRLKAEIAEKDAEIDRLKKELEDAQSQAKSDDEKSILNMVAVAGGMDWLKGVQSTGKIDKRPTDTGNLDKAQAKRNEKISLTEYRRLKAERLKNNKK